MVVGGIDWCWNVFLRNNYFTMDDCVFCKEPLSNGKATVVLQIKGCKGIHKAKEARGDSLYVEPGQTVHQDCRKDY